MDAMEDAIEVTAQTLKTLSSEVTVLKKHNDELLKRCDDEHAKITMLEKENQNLKKQNSVLEEAKTKLNQEASAHKKDLKKEKAKFEKLERSHEEATEKIAKHNKKTDTPKKTVSATTHETLKKQHADLATQVNHLTSENGTLQNQLDRTTKSFERQAAQLEKALEIAQGATAFVTSSSESGRGSKKSRVDQVAQDLSAQEGLLNLVTGAVTGNIKVAVDVRSRKWSCLAIG